MLQNLSDLLNDPPDLEGRICYAGNFSDEELIEAIRFAHLRGCRIYLTLNTLIKEREFDELTDYLRPLDAALLDGVIVQDPGVLSLIRERFPALPVHASTQMAVTGAYGVSWLAGRGVRRVVPARELSLTEMAEIKKRTGERVELEAFIHGAMCYSYSVERPSRFGGSYLSSPRASLRPFS